MNAAEIEDAISALAEQPFDVDEFPFGFGAKETILRRVIKGAA